MKFRIEDQKITLQELQEFEALLEGLQLPEDYKQHMLQYNGGYPKGDYVCFEPYEGIITLSYFNPIKYGASTMEDYLDMRNVFPKNQILIGIIVGGMLIISLDENSYGHIYIAYEDVNPEKIANSFTEFINGLFEADPDTYF